MLPYEEIPDIVPSYAEKKVISLLSSNNIVFAREVVFKDCVNPLTGIHLRFDFYLPVQNVLIEYDGKDFHSSPEVKSRDKIKYAFAKKNKITLIRVQGISNIDLLVRHRSIKHFIASHTTKRTKEVKINPYSRENRIKDKIQQLQDLRDISKPRFMKMINDMKKDRSNRNINLEVIRRINLL